jgi:hypothetical protein
MCYHFDLENKCFYVLWIFTTSNLANLLKGKDAKLQGLRILHI